MDRNRQIQFFWSRFTMRDLAPFLGAVFCTFGAFGFLRDVSALGRSTPAYLAYLVLSGGLVAVGYVLAMRHGWRRWLPVVVLIQLGTEYFGQRWLSTPLPPLAASALKDRLWLDSTLSFVALFAGYLGFVHFIARQGLRRLRLDVEIGLAREIHDTLVPRLALQAGGFEVVGASFPASEVGGDLVDAVPAGQRLTCYLADVSGHGVPAGTLMAALKSAARMRLLRAATGAELLADLNTVLLQIKQPNMFATAATLVAEGSRVHYALAGHLPILQWRRETRTIVRHGEGELALGILEGRPYAELPIEVAPGDVLAVVTDGLTEVADRRERELGIEGIEAALLAHGEEPLAQLAESILARARAHGPQRDDQTLLLLRRLA
jgi:phosphoserine phosphatase RsbU/P